MGCIAFQRRIDADGSRILHFGRIYPVSATDATTFSRCSCKPSSLGGHWRRRVATQWVTMT